MGQFNWNEVIFFGLVLPILLIVGTIITIWIISERKARKDTEQKLKSLENSLSECKSTDARIIYVSYFGKPVDHTGDGFIDGYE